MVDRECLRTAADLRDAVEWNEFAVGGTDIEVRKFSRVELVFRGDFEDDLILGCGAVDGGYLPGAEGVLQGVFDLTETQAVGGDFVAVDIQGYDRALVLEVAIDINEAGQLTEA